MITAATVAKACLDGCREDVRRVALRYGVTTEEILGRSRYAWLVKARHALWAEVVDKYGWNYSKVGRVFDRTASNVSYAMRKKGKRNVL